MEAGRASRVRLAWDLFAPPIVSRLRANDGVDQGSILSLVDHPPGISFPRGCGIPDLPQRGVENPRATRRRAIA